jgi:hypothetical protein
MQRTNHFHSHSSATILSVIVIVIVIVIIIVIIITNVVAFTVFVITLSCSSKFIISQHSSLSGLFDQVVIAFAPSPCWP